MEFSKGTKPSEQATCTKTLEVTAGVESVHAWRGDNYLQRGYAAMKMSLAVPLQPAGLASKQAYSGGPERILWREEGRGGGKNLM